MAENKRDTRWYCVNSECGEPLGNVLGAELYVSESVKEVHTKGVNVVLSCPKCGTKKVWYTSDAINRAMYQLIDAIAGQLAYRVMQDITKEQHKSKGK